MTTEYVIDFFAEKLINDFTTKNSITTKDVLSMASYLPASVLKRMIEKGGMKILLDQKDR